MKWSMSLRQHSSVGERGSAALDRAATIATGYLVRIPPHRLETILYYAYCNKNETKYFKKMSNSPIIKKENIKDWNECYNDYMPKFKLIIFLQTFIWIRLISLHCLSVIYINKTTNPLCIFDYCVKRLSLSFPQTHKLF